MKLLELQLKENKDLIGNAAFSPDNAHSAADGNAQVVRSFKVCPVCVS